MGTSIPPVPRTTQAPGNTSLDANGIPTDDASQQAVMEGVKSFCTTFWQGNKARTDEATKPLTEPQEDDDDS